MVGWLAGGWLAIHGGAGGWVYLRGLDLRFLAVGRVSALVVGWRFSVESLGGYFFYTTTGTY